MIEKLELLGTKNHLHSFDSSYNGQTINREGWMHSSIGRSRVFGDYLRICFTVTVETYFT